MGSIKDTKQVGKLVYSKGNSVNIREYANSTSKIVKTAQRVINGNVTAFGKLTGFYAKMQDGFTWWHIQVGNLSGWCREDVITVSLAPVTDQQAQSMMNELVSNNIKIRETLTAQIPLLKKLRSEGKLSDVQLSEFKNLSSRLLKREAEIRSNKALKVQTGIKTKYNDFMLKWGLSSLTISGIDNDKESIGVIPVIVWIVGVVVVAGLGAGIYAYFKSYWGESKSDLVLSDELSKVLSTLDPQTSAAIKADLEGQIDDAYTKGREDEKGEGGIFGSNKNLIYVALGIIGAKFLLK